MIKKENISILPHTSCTGCKMCGDVCPKNSIDFCIDNEGFVYPQVDNDTCINCGLCSQKCPALSMSFAEKPNIVYSAYATDNSVRNTGSSGGIFALLASNIISKGGVVFGSAFNEKLQLKHKGIDKIEDLHPLCKSKYLQSDCRYIYNAVNKELLLDKIVLFCGTPCQCQALKNYVDKRCLNNLLLLDFVCHGVPSQFLFNENLKWNGNKYGKVTNVEFRIKDKKVRDPHTLKMTYNKGNSIKSIFRIHYQDPFYFGFEKRLTYRPSCYRCLWARGERCSDITVADFWGIEKLNVNLDSKHGVSNVILNTKKGKIAFDLIKDKISGINEIPYDFAISNNDCLREPTKEPSMRADFFKDLSKMGYGYCVSNYLTPKRKWIFDVYYVMPSILKKIVKKVMRSRINYE